MTGLILYAMIICHGAFEYRSGDPNLLFPVQSAVHDSSFPVIMGTPALLPFAEGFMFNCNAGRPYSEKILATEGFAVQYGSGDYGLQSSWNSFGGDFYREHTFSFMGGYSIFSSLHAGITENVRIIKIETNELSMSENFYDTDLALLYTPFPWISAAFIQTGIVSLFSGQNNGVICPVRSAGIMIKPCSGFSLSWNIADTEPAYANTFSAVINPARFLSVSGGYCRENSSFAASFGVAAARVFVSYGLRYHPYLGYTHSIGITYTPDPEIESLNYGRPLLSAAVEKKINIKTAEIDDLKKIEGLSALSAGRIILYRQKIGPVSEKALMQIGLTADEIRIFEANTYGLERTRRSADNEKKFKHHKKNPPRKERIKNKFRALISGGIRAYTAITYSEFSETAEIDQFSSRLNSDNSLTAEQKKFIESTCYEQHFQ